MEMEFPYGNSPCFFIYDFLSVFAIGKNGHSLFSFVFYSTASICIFTKLINQVPIIKSQFVYYLIFGMLSVLISTHQVFFNLYWKIWRPLGDYFHAKNNISFISLSYLYLPTFFSLQLHFC